MGSAGYHGAVNAHYGDFDLSARIREMLGRRAATRDELAAFDEFHTGGRTSTRALADLVALAPGMLVLDVGSGVGGPARTLAAERGARVAGLDLTRDFCRAARMLTAMIGMSAGVTFQQGDALALPYADERFDVVWSQNTIMNIPDKGRLFAEIRRVLKPGGAFALEAALAGPAGGEVRYPTFWAGSAELSFLDTPGRTRELLLGAGLTVEEWEDVTAANVEQARQRATARRATGARPLGRDVIVRDAVTEKIDNSLRNGLEGRIVAVRVVYRKPADAGGA
jgi:SAM-dependent methyltransferase